MFGRRKQEQVDPEAFVDDLDPEDRAHEDALLLAELEGERSAELRSGRGPWDSSEDAGEDVARVDLGGLRVPVPPGTEVRVDVGSAGEVVAASLVQGSSQMKLNAFAAPRSGGVWAEVRAEITTALRSAGGTAEEVQGTYGPELRATVPTQVPEQGTVLLPARFLGVDGPRWFLRALLTGPAAQDDAAAASLEDALRQVVVVRGADPMAVKDPLPLRLPPDTATAPTPAAPTAAAPTEPDPSTTDQAPDPAST